MDKFKAANFDPIIPENPVTLRDKLMKECWCEIKGVPVPPGIKDEKYEGPPEARIEELKKKMRSFEEKAEKIVEERKTKEKKVAAEGDSKSSS